jgi:hypothetical protein
MKDIFETADKNNFEEDFASLWKIYEVLLCKNDKVILEHIAINLKDCLGYMRRFLLNEESVLDESPHSVQSDNFTSSSMLTPSNGSKKIIWK